jgi:predicted RNase H-like HicB family nuclease
MIWMLASLRYANFWSLVNNKTLNYINFLGTCTDLFFELILTENTIFSAILWKEGKLQIAWSPALDIASQGKNVEDALSNLREAIELYLEDEDAKIPADRSAIFNTLSVETHIKAETCVRP